MQIFLYTTCTCKAWFSLALYVLLHPVKTASSLLSPLTMSLHHQNFGEEAIIDIFSSSNSTPKIVFYKVTNEAFLWKISKGNLKRSWYEFSTWLLCDNKLEARSDNICPILGKTLVSNKCKNCSYHLICVVFASSGYSWDWYLELQQWCLQPHGAHAVFAASDKSSESRRMKAFLQWNICDLYSVNVYTMI